MYVSVGALVLVLVVLALFMVARRG